MSTKQQELLQSQTNVGETYKENSSEPLIERGEIKGTPFHWWKRTEEGKYHIALGKYRLNDEPIHTQEELEEYLYEHEWDIILKMIMITTTDLLEAAKRHNDTNKAKPVETY